MNDKTKHKHISDVAVLDKEMQVKKPFKISNENRRRFIRLEISSPVALRNIKDALGMVPNEELYNMNGVILNISSGGVLVELEEVLAENDFVLMKFTMQDVETIENVLGSVKRVDTQDDFHLAGIEFVTPESLEDKLSHAELDLIKGKINNFNAMVQETLGKYLYKN